MSDSLGIATYYSTIAPDRDNTDTSMADDNQSSDVTREFATLSDGGFAFMGLMLTLNYVMGSFINALCLFVFAKHKHLRSPTNIFVMSLNLCDFLMCFIGTPLSMTSAWSHRWLWGPVGCNVEAFTVYVLGLSSMYLLTAISFDRYIAISRPLMGHKITKKVALLSAGGCFVAGAMWSIFPLIGWNEYTLEGAGISCSVMWYNTDLLYQSYIWTIFLLAFFFPLGIMIFSYSGVLNTLHNLNKTSVWDMNSRVGRRNLSIEKKMLKTSVMIVGSFLGCWLLYTVVSLISAFGYAHVIPTFFATVPPIIAKCQGLLNPIILVSRHRAFQRAFLASFDVKKRRRRRKADRSQGPIEVRTDIVHCLIDPVIYVAMNQQFRNAFYDMLPCQGLKGRLLANKVQPVEEESEESDVEADDGKAATRKGNKDKADATKNSGVPAKPGSDKADGKKGKTPKKKKSASRNAVHALNVPAPSEVSDEGVSQISMLDPPTVVSVTPITIIPASEGATVTYTSGTTDEEPPVA